MSLTFATVIFFSIMLGMLGVSIFRFWQRPQPATFLLFLIVIVAGSFFVALVMCMPTYRPLRAARLLCFGWFLFLPAYLTAVLFMTKIRWLRAISVLLTVMLLTIAGYSFLIEPFRLEVTEFTIRSPKVNRPLKLALLADFQTDQFRNYERDSLAQIMAWQPDAIFCAGDYLQSENQQGWQELRDAMNAHLRSISFRAEMGIFAVGGNTDFRRWPEIFRGLEANLFTDTRFVETSEFAVTGLSVEDSFNTTLEASPVTDKFHIVLGHAPDFSLSPSNGGDLLLAGHTHGGQVRLPGIGPLVTFSKVPRHWAAGKTPLANGRMLVVSRGVGMERRDAPRLRFLCRPQLVFIRVEPVPATNQSD